MALLSYAGVNFGNSRTIFYTEEPDVDSEGKVDPLTTCLTVEVQSILNPAWLATNVLNGRGDRAGTTLLTIRAALETPRLQLIFAVGPDRIVASPAVDPTDPNGVRLLRCDAKNGPIPEVIRFTEIVGDKSIFIHFRVKTWIRNQGNVLLSNRWSITCDTDFQGLTTRTINGQAVIRTDAIGLFGIHGADDFRRNLFIPCPNNFIRQRPVVVQSEDGCTVNYTVTDQETSLTLGATQVAVEIQGNATAGSESQIKDLPGVANTVWDMINKAIHQDIPGIIGTVVKSIVPQNKANALVRCYGRRKGPAGISIRQALAQLACRIIQDRFGAAAMVTSAYCTQGIDSAKGPWVEVRVEYFPTAAAIAGGLFDGFGFEKQFASMADDIIVGGGAETIFGNNPNAQNPAMKAGNTRGSYLGALVAQTFAPAGSPPNAPPADVPATNLPNF